MGKVYRIGKNTIETTIKGSFQEIKLMREGKIPERTMDDLYKDIIKWKDDNNKNKASEN